MRKKRLVFCNNNTPPTIIKIERSRKSESIVEARASIMELASVKREIISPVRLVAKKDIGNSKICRIYDKITSMVSR